jgi:uncharacterized damage-inducible protein DinB
MTNTAELLADAFGRIREGVHDVVDGLTSKELAFRPGGQANSIAWLVWHLTRVQDDHLAAVVGGQQVWVAGHWFHRFELPFEESATGYGQRSEEVAAVTPADDALLTGYHDAVCEQTLDFVRGLTDPDLDRVVDERWDPPVTLAVRLVSVLSDDLQHVGQAAFVRGLVHPG